MFSATAEGETTYEHYPRALGAHGVIDIAGGVGLGGLSFQQWFGKLGLQLTAGGGIGNDRDYNYNLVAALQYMLYGDDFNDWFSGALYANLLVAHSADGSSYEPYTPRGHVGLGVGIEMTVLRHLSWSVEFMYLGTEGPANWPPTIGFGMGFSLRYRY